MLHLQLNLKKATDDEARRWLARKLLVSKKVNAELADEKEQLLERQQQDQDTMEEINSSLRALKEENEKLLSQMENDCQEKLRSNEEES